jgi:hypothetical protein
MLMKIKKDFLSLVISCLFIINTAIFLPVPEYAYAQEQEKIVEEVEVVNVMLPVRVFYKGEPVKGLKKQDFRVEVNGKAVPINAFFEKSKKIAVTEVEAKKPAFAPRLFVLVFTVSDYNINLKQYVDTLFQKIIRPNDRLIVVSNHYFLNDRTVTDVKKEKEIIKKILEHESRLLRWDLRRIETELKSIAQDTMNRGGSPQSITKEFQIRYLNIYDDYKSRYNNLKKVQSLNMAEYLKKQDLKKWVIHFHQLGMFPQLKPSWDIQGQSGLSLRALFEGWAENSPWVRAELTELNAKVRTADNHMVSEISKYFLNSRVTFHTLLMKGINTIFLDHFVYKPVATNSESIMRKITSLTGGEVAAGTNVEAFIEKISQKEDVYYVLSYIPLKTRKQQKVKVTLNVDKAYRIVYDNQERPRYMKKMIKKATQPNPQIQIKNLSYENGILALHLTSIKMGDSDTRKRGKIYLRIKIVNDKSEVQTQVEKTFLCKKENFVLRVKPPKLKKGNYDIVAEVSDLLTGKNDMTIKDITINR